MDDSTLLPWEESGQGPVSMALAGAWNEELTRRLRALYHSDPLFDMRRNSCLTDEARDYDLGTLGIKALDFVGEEMGIGGGATTEEVIGGLLPLLVAMDEEAGRPLDHQKHRRVAQKVMDYLLNRGEGARQFQVPYTVISEETCKAERRILSFRLLAEIHSPTKGVVIQLEDAAINLVFRMLDVDLESSMAATEAILEHLIRRGRFDEAVQSARQAFGQARMYSVRLQGLRQNMKSDIRLADDIKAMREAQVFIQERQEKDRVILGQVIAQQEQLQQDGGAVGGMNSKYRGLLEVKELLMRCSAHYASLSMDILGTHDEYRREHGRQSLRARTRYHRSPNLMADAAPRIFGSPLATIERSLAGFYQSLVGFHSPEIFSFGKLISPLINSRDEESEAVSVVEEVAVKETLFETLSEDEWKAVMRVLRSVEEGVSLGEILRSMRDWDDVDGRHRLGVMIEVLLAHAHADKKEGVRLRVPVEYSRRLGSGTGRITKHGL